MRKGSLALAALGLLVGGSTAACNDEPGLDPSRPGKIGVILPDTTSAERWTRADPTYLKAAFDAAGIESDIENANGDRRRFEAIADEMINDGITVLMIVNLDSRNGKTVLAKARSKGIATIDYDRLTLNGGADYHVSFDHVEVGRLQGVGMVRCLVTRGAKEPAIVQLNGPPTDHNATLLKRGYDSVLRPKYNVGQFNQGPEQPVPNWDSTEASAIFEQMLLQTGGKVDGVVAASDALGNAAISVLRERRRNGAVPVTGQEATMQGLQNVLVGDQCMTVHKPIKKEAAAAAELAIAIVKGGSKPATQVIEDPESGADIPAVLLPPKLIYKEDIKDVVREGFVTKAKLCGGKFAAKCREAGIR